MPPTRRGKIARLPLVIRDELNRRLLENEPYKKLCAWLNALPEGLAVCDEFGEQPIDERNVSDWKLGGFADWLRRRETLDQTKDLAKYSMDLAKASGGNLSEGAAAILAGQILEVLEDVSRLKANGEKQTPEQTAMLAGAIKDLTDSLSSIRGGDHNRVKLDQNVRRLEQKDELIELERDRSQRMSCSMFVKWAERKAALDLAGSDAPLADKIEALGQLMFPDTWKPASAATPGT